MNVVVIEAFNSCRDQSISIVDVSKLPPSAYTTAVKQAIGDPNKVGEISDYDLDTTPYTVTLPALISDVVTIFGS